MFANIIVGCKSLITTIGNVIEIQSFDSTVKIDRNINICMFFDIVNRIC